MSRQKKQENSNQKKVEHAETQISKPQTRAPESEKKKKTAAKSTGKRQQPDTSVHAPEPLTEENAAVDTPSEASIVAEDEKKKKAAVSKPPASPSLAIVPPTSAKGAWSKNEDDTPTSAKTGWGKREDDAPTPKSGWGKSDEDVRTPTKPAWGKSEDDPRTPTNTPSLREIQEAEAKRAEAIRIQKDKFKAERLAAEIRIAQESAWSAPEGATSSAPWQPPQASKKSLREIQMEEEEKQRQRARREREQQAAAAASVGVPSQPASLASAKRYADMAANSSNGPMTMSSVAAAAARRPPAQPAAGSAWITVGGKGSSQPAAVKPAAQNAWKAPTPQSIAATQQAALAKRAASPAPQEGPSADFMNWCRHSLRSVTDANVDELIQMFLTFPVEANPSTIEIISEAVYASSPSLNGRSFAEEFVRRRKLDSAPGATGGQDAFKNASTPTGSDNTGFKVVAKKGRKRN